MNDAAEFSPDNVTKLITDLESEELDSHEGVAVPEVYSQLLTAYLLQNDLSNAKLLWKRIPSALKVSNPELGKIWEIGRKLWLRDFPQIYKELENTEWSGTVQTMMKSLLENVRDRAIRLVSTAYSSVCLSDFIEFVGLSSEASKSAAIELGWKYDSTTDMLYPVKPERSQCMAVANEEQLAKLTDFVTFLEN